MNYEILINKPEVKAYKIIDTKKREIGIPSVDKEGWASIAAMALASQGIDCSFSRHIGDEWDAKHARCVKGKLGVSVSLEDIPAIPDGEPQLVVDKKALLHNIKKQLKSATNGLATIIVNDHFAYHATKVDGKWKLNPVIIEHN